MKIDERLKTLCDECISKGRYTKTTCPFRSISNDYCDNIETLQKDLEVLEILKKHISIQMFDSMEIYEKIIVSKWLGL